MEWKWKSPSVGAFFLAGGWWLFTTSHHQGEFGTSPELSTDAYIVDNTPRRVIQSSCNLNQKLNLPYCWFVCRCYLKQCLYYRISFQIPLIQAFCNCILGISRSHSFSALLKGVGASIQTIVSANRNSRPLGDHDSRSPVFV